jgi:two-component system OmpR family response regulator
MHDNRPKILIADDDPEMLSLLVDVLEPDGYKLLLAHDVQGAIQLAVAHEPDLMLLDVVMPDGGGYAVCRELNERAPEQRPVVIFLTGLDQPEQMQHAFSLGAEDYITKPFSIALLRTRVRTWLVRLGKLGPGDASITASPPAADPSQPPVS